MGSFTIDTATLTIAPWGADVAEEWARIGRIVWGGIAPLPADLLRARLGLPPLPEPTGVGPIGRLGLAPTGCVRGSTFDRKGR